MVAISLYRGNLHRAPDVPRRWLMPAPKISLKYFKSLLARRSKALSRRLATASTPIANSNPNPTSLSTAQNATLIKSEPITIDNHGEGPSGKGEKDNKEAELVGSSSEKPVDGSDSIIDSKIDVLVKASDPLDAGANSRDKQTQTITDSVDLLNDKEKRKREVEDKLQVLNQKKHNLVLVLKQILNAEEELKRRISMQGNAMRPSVPIQADGEGGEADDLSNHNMHSRHMLRTSSMSPSSDYPLRRTPSVQQNMVSHASRASLGSAGSPSHFALSGYQGNPMNLPSVSVSGTSYIASSPSPAASGGTSVFRDARQPSPWK